MSVVLVLDANQRSALAVTRSLGSIDNVTIVAADSTTTALAGSSKFCRNYVQCPSPATAPNAFLEWIQPFLVEHKIDFVFPVTEITSQLLLMNPSVLGDSKLPFADYDTVMSLATKDALVKTAQAAGVHTPESQFFSSTQDPSLKAYLERHSIQFPVVIKPSLSRICLGTHWMDTTVQIAHNTEQLNTFLAGSEWLHEHPFMLQQFIPGHGAGLFALYNEGEPVAFFSHQRLREKPPEGGVSVLSTSIALDPLLLEAAKKLLAQAKWHGVAMVEFRVAEDGTPYLMEVNTRFWGSLQLAIDAGVDFPNLLFQVISGQKPPLHSGYKLGVKLRWFLGDFDSLYLVLKSRKFSLGFKLARLLAFITPKPFSTRHEVNRLSDFGPAMTELRHYIRNILH